MLSTLNFNRALLAISLLTTSAVAGAQSGKRVVEQSDLDVKLGFVHVESMSSFLKRHLSAKELKS